MHLRDAIKRMRMSVVQVGAMAADGSLTPLGSGFLVHEGRHAITAKHVTDALPAGTSLMVGIPGPDVDEPDIQVRAAFVTAPATLIDVTDDEDDLALLEIALPPGATQLEATITARMADGTAKVYTSGPSKPAPLHTGPALPEGTELAVSGFPLSHPAMVTTAGVLASTFAPLLDSTGETRVRHLGDVTANGGNSGGPVYTVNDARVIGVCVAGRLARVIAGAGHYAAGLTEIVPMADVLKLLETNKLAPNPTDAPPRAKSRNRRKGK